MNPGDGGRRPDDPTLTKLLGQWGAGGAARDEVVALVYDELRRIAHRGLHGERIGHTLQTTALVNEAYLRMIELDRMHWTDRAHFFAMAATLMRRILVDYARQRGRDKRGGGISIVTLDGQDVAAETGVDIAALDDALERLAALDTAQARIVELRFFSGLTVDETAAALDISPSTVKREWASAKAWLLLELEGR
ncbi:MAG: sigma-70 family RNA polymerase sigma factor [Acidobacteriota bacterium]